jgi:serine/threonine protein kinase
VGDRRISESPRNIGRGRRYRLLQPLSKDRLGILWQGEDRIVRAPIAVRVLSPWLFRDQDAVDAIRLRLAAVCPRLNHPSAGRVITYNYGEDGREQFVVMEPLEGETLASRLARTRVLSPAEGAGIAARVADALQAAHDLGLAHGGLVSSSVILTTGGEVKVIDFGVAHLAAALSGPEADAPHEGEGAQGGHSDVRALAHLAAALSGPGAKASHVGEGAPGGHSDVRALAVLFVQMVAGEDATKASLGGEEQHDEVSPVARFRMAMPFMPHQAARTVEAALEEDPASRPTAAEMAAAFRLSVTRDIAATPQAEPSVPAPLDLWAAEPTVEEPVLQDDQPPVVPVIDGSVLGSWESVDEVAAAASTPAGNGKGARRNLSSVAGLWRQMPRGLSLLAAAALLVVAALAVTTLGENTPEVRGGQQAIPAPTSVPPPPPATGQPSPEVSVVAPPGTVVVPNVVGLSALDAQQSLRRAGLVFAGAAPVVGAPGSVLGTDPPTGTSVAPGTRVLVLVGTDPQRLDR